MRPLHLPAPSRRFPLWLILLGAVVHAVLGLVVAFGQLSIATLLDIGTGVYAVGVVAGSVFWLLYSLLARWHRSAIGVMFWLLGLASVTTGIVVLASLLFGSGYPGREYVRIVGYLVQTDAMIVLLLVYLVERRDPHSALPPMRLPAHTGPLPIVDPDAPAPTPTRSTI